MPVDNVSLERWRSLDALLVLQAVAACSKVDPTYVPVKASTSRRVHATVAGRDFELLLTGVKFWDARRAVGGGGAIDLVIHVFETDFKGAARILKQCGL